MDQILKLLKSVLQALNTVSECLFLLGPDSLMTTGGHNRPNQLLPIYLAQVILTSPGLIVSVNQLAQLDFGRCSHHPPAKAESISDCEAISPWASSATAGSGWSLGISSAVESTTLTPVSACGILELINASAFASGRGFMPIPWRISLDEVISLRANLSAISAMPPSPPSGINLNGSRKYMIDCPCVRAVLVRKVRIMASVIASNSGSMVRE